MPIRAIIIMLVAAFVLAVCYREPIYQWFKDLGKTQKETETTDEKSEEEKENQD